MILNGKRRDAVEITAVLMNPLVSVEGVVHLIGIGVATSHRYLNPSALSADIPTGTTRIVSSPKV